MIRIISVLFMALGGIFFYIFAMTFIGALDGGAFLFFEIFFSFVWGLGVLIFGGAGFALFKSDQRRRRELKIDKGNEEV